MPRLIASARLANVNRFGLEGGKIKKVILSFTDAFTCVFYMMWVQGTLTTCWFDYDFQRDVIVFFAIAIASLVLIKEESTLARLFHNDFLRETMCIFFYLCWGLVAVGCA